MSELTQQRDHCRAMANMTEPITERVQEFDDVAECFKWRDVVVTPVPTPAERQLWTQLADEIDVYLTGDSVDVDLFGHLTVVPNLPNEETP